MEESDKLHMSTNLEVGTYTFQLKRCILNLISIIALEGDNIYMKYLSDD